MPGHADGGEHWRAGLLPVQRGRRLEAPARRAPSAIDPGALGAHRVVGFADRRGVVRREGRPAVRHVDAPAAATEVDEGSRDEKDGRGSNDDPCDFAAVQPVFLAFACRGSAW